MQDTAHMQRRAQLEHELSEIDQEDRAGANDRATVTLDQQSVGRLSRMDALQRQALAQATGRRRAARRQRVLAALARMDESEFGSCEDCGDQIAAKRLDFDATITRCVECAG